MVNISTSMMLNQSLTPMLSEHGSTTQMQQFDPGCCGGDKRP